MNGKLLAMVVPALLGLAVGWGFGQRGGDASPTAPSHLAVLTRDLGLRPDQIAAISGLFAAQDRDLQQLVEAQRTSLREPIAARLARTEDDMLALLDDEQRATYERLVASH